ncbi:hypothetical protein GCM10017044_15620 [Kordiimonas sediminis]|uniref:Uncharacterized protein n=1 Tax=Kordiimonas sediminis TaxID=1735581 RepID=A0A919ARX0_9PROT|nr:hypothetical protein [Kordiimonas sediminis]GHF22345.1 hypothetical protein GCM10017044_15620 [Kordiimonas sediminis]
MTMKAVILGRLRINLEHLVWYSGTGTPGSDEEHEQPGLSIKTMDSESPLSIRYKSFASRDADLAMLDNIFSAQRSILIDDQTTQPPSDTIDAPEERSRSTKNPVKKSATEKTGKKTTTGTKPTKPKPPSDAAKSEQTKTTKASMIETLMGSDQHDA